MTKRNVLIGSSIGVVAIALALVWWLGFFSESPEEATLEAAVEAVTGTEGDETDSQDVDSGEATGETAQGTPGVDSTPDLNGTWTVQANADATFVGYRINEVLNTIGDFEVVGRTSDVSGSLVIDGSTISEVSVVAQMGTLTTDNSGRDNAMRNQALETEQFPEATFTLTTPIELDVIPDEGQTMQTTATGELTIHGVTQVVDFPLEAQLVGESIVVVGQLPMLLADYAITAPSAPIVASVEDNALLELSIVLAR